MFYLKDEFKSEILNFQGRIVLLAEDDEGHSILIKKLLKEHGVSNEFVRLKDGEELLSYLNQNVNEDFLILLDLSMPKVNGMEFLEEIKGKVEYKNNKVFVVTTTAEKPILDKCVDLGVIGYCVKTIEYDHFIENMKKLSLVIQGKKLDHD